jgi:anti-anti-sigma factor
MIPIFTVRRYNLGRGSVKIAVSGEVDVDTSGALGAIIIETAQAGAVELIIDLDRVTFLDAAGIRALLVGREVAVRHGCAYRVINPRGFVHSVLAVAGVLTILDVTTTISSTPDDAHGLNPVATRRSRINGLRPAPPTPPSRPATGGTPGSPRRNPRA